MNFKKLFINTFFAIVTFLIGISAFVIIVDPYQQYRKSDVFIVNQRLENPGVARHHDYDMVITGSSMAMNHYCSQVDSLFDCNSINLSIMGATSYGYETLFKSLYESGKMRQVIIALDYFSFCRSMVPLDMYLYDDCIWNDYEYWINYSSVKNAVVKLTNKFTPSRDSVYRFKSPNNREQLRKCYKNAQSSYFKGEDYDLKQLTKRFDQMMDVIAPEKNDVNYYFYFPPYSVLEFRVMQQYGYWENVKQFKEYIMNRLLSFDNVKLYDFQSDIMTTDVEEYMDLRHHSHDYSKKVIDSMSKDSCLVTKANYKQHLKNWEHIVDSFDVKELIDF